MNRSPLAPMSAKRRAALAAAGVVNPRSTLTATVPLARRPVMSAPKPIKRPADTGPDAATVALVFTRDGGRCVRCGSVVTGARGVGWSVQHRRARGKGGSRRPDTNMPQNLIILCGSATTGCHHHVESHRTEARDDYGWAVRMHGRLSDPLLIPVTHATLGRVFLTADGGWRAALREVA